MRLFTAFYRGRSSCLSGADPSLTCDMVDSHFPSRYSSCSIHAKRQFETLVACIFIFIFYTTSLVYIILYSRSPRWTSGSPRMLLLSVREFESRRGEILNLFAKKKRRKRKGSTAESASSVGKHNSTRVDEGRKLKSSRDKNARHEP